MQRDTAILHAGYREPASPGPALAGPQFSATFTNPGAPSEHAYSYGRFHNPTWTAWEAALAVLEEGEAVVFASGMAAAAAVFGTTLKPGDIVLLPSDSYYTTRLLAADWLASIGIQVRLAPTRDDAQAAVLDGVRLFWVETPSNPQLDVCDIEALARAAHAAGALVAVDNTTATGYLQHPLRLGADLVVASDTKALTGHGDLVLGHAATRNAELAAALRNWRTRHGAVPGPMEVWLAHRSLATLPLRLSRQCESAQGLAEFLSGQDKIRNVLYPGLASHPGHAIARRQMDAFGGVLSFELPTQAQAEAFLGALRLVRVATSFGGVHSTAERRARWGGDAIGEGFIRFSVGCEALEDLRADVASALRGVSASGA
jgi:cystathionine gamma-lyase